MSKAIITGGSGFVGKHLINHLSIEGTYSDIIVADLVPPSQDVPNSTTKIHYVECDVRKPIDAAKFKRLGCNSDTVIYNLAAICRIPGFPTIDYYQTNIKGAETVCKLADELGVQHMVFTSSIAPYGASEEVKTEESVPQPDNPYGSSKLVAEYVHRGWYEKDQNNRMLAILRPGIIFGKGEQANFTRLYQAQRKGYFAYPGRKDTRKACIYVKDVARACFHYSNKPAGYYLYNLVYEKPPTIEKICIAVAENTNAHKPLFRIPGPLLLTMAYGIMGAGKLIGHDFAGIHPDRVKKVMISTNVEGKKLAASDFKFKYNLVEGIRDWYNECDGKLA